MNLPCCLPCFLVFLAGQIIPFPSGPDNEAEVAAVRKVFYDYKTALLNGDGRQAVALVDAETLAYYDKIKRLALEGDAETVRAESFINRLLIVSIRHELEPQTLKGMELEDLIQHVVEAGWIRKESIMQLDIGTIEVGGDVATGQALTAGTVTSDLDTNAPAPLTYEFAKQGGEWKFRFGSLVESLNQIITQFSQTLGTNEDDLIFQLVESLSGREVLPDVWESPE